MAISLVTVGGKITAAIQNAIIGQVNAQGLTGVVPTSVAGTGVALGANGKVTFTAATSISVNTAFTATYDHYFLLLDCPAIATAANLLLRLRAAGTDLSTSSYGYGGTSNTATASSVSTGITTGFYLTRNPVGAIQASGVVEVFAPQLAVVKRIHSKVMTTNSTYITADTVGGNNNSSIAYDGFTLVNDGGFAMTGTLRIYGRNNN